MLTSIGGFNKAEVEQHGKVHLHEVSAARLLNSSRRDLGTEGCSGLLPAQGEVGLQGTSVGAMDDGDQQG